jgi:hypothetical protein
VKGVTSTVKVPRQFLPVFFVGLMEGLWVEGLDEFLCRVCRQYTASILIVQRPYF